MRRLEQATRSCDRPRGLAVVLRRDAMAAIACALLTWLAVAFALGGAAPASQQAASYMAGQAIGAIGQQQSPDGMPAREKWAAPMPADSFDSSWSPDVAEASDLADLYSGSRFHGPLSPSASRLSDYPAPVRRFESGGTHARGPPRLTGQA